MKIMFSSYKLLLCLLLLLSTNALKAIEEFSLIPAGAFTMGNSVAADTDITDAPARTVTLDAFYMGKYEVTKAEWDEVKTWGLTNGYTDLADGAGKAGNHPVHSISWYDMVKWCNARSQKEGLAPVYYTNDAQTTIYKTGSVDVTNAQVKWTANGYRPPTETEWEKAARGGLSGKRFPWGDTINHDQSNFKNFENEDYQSGTRDYHPQYSVELQPYTAPVGSFDPNGYDLHDMAGNVWEMCWDIYGSYPSGNLNNPRGALSGAYRTFRGGSWDDEASCMRVALRGDDGLPGLKDEWTGFRLARSAIRTSINGEVTDRNGSPLSGVAVTAHQYSPDGDSSNSLAWASTDASGKYALEGLDPGTYRIRFNGSANEPPLSDLAPQYFNNAPSLALAQDVVLTSLGSVNNIDAILKEASRITGNITSAADGNPLGDILVIAHRMMDDGEWDRSSWVNFTWSESDGSYALNLPEGAYMVSFYDYNNKYYVTEFYDNQRKSDNAQPIILQANSTVSNINASLAKASRISGVVTGPDGVTPLAGIYVAAFEDRYNDEWWHYASGVITDENGQYSINGLSQGTYRVKFEDDDGEYAIKCYGGASAINSADDIVVIESQEVSGINASLAKASRISGVVTAADGSPLKGISVSVHQYDAKDEWWHWVTGAETDELGEYSLGGLAAGIYRVEFRDYVGEYAVECYDNAPHLDSAKDIVVAESTDISGINASLVKASGISGVVTGPDGQTPLTDAEVELELWTGNDWSWQDQTSTDGNGSYQFDGLPAGTYRIKFEDESGEYALEYYNNEVEFDLAENIVLAPEQQLENINASLVPGSRINGKMTGPDGNPLAAVWVDVFRLQENGQWDWYEDTEANADGTYEIGGLPNGTYRVGFLDDDEVHAVQFYENNGNTMYFELAHSFVISSPETIPGVNAKFDKKAVTIKGKVTGSDGSTPLHEVRIEAYRKDDEGTWRLVLFGDTRPVDDGFFNTGILPAGTYRFKFQKDGYLTKFYGNVATLADAKDIVLGDGQVVEGINVSLSTEPAVSPPITLSGTVMVSYWEGTGTYEYHYFKSPNQLFFLDYEEWGDHSYTYNSTTGQLKDLNFQEDFILSFVSASKGKFTFSDSEITNGSGSFFFYDSTWDLDFDGVPDGLQIERGNLPNLIHPLDLSSDVDGDGLSLAREGELGTNPNIADIAPSITAQPVTATANQGGSATFSVTATGTNLSYQWKKNGADLAGQTGAQLLLNNLQDTQAGSYTVVVSNAIGSETSTAAQLAVVIPPGITAQPAAATANQGASASFSVTATGTNLSYQWKRNGADLAGEAGDTLSLNNLQGTQAGNYTVAVSNSAGSVTSNAAVLTVLGITSDLDRLILNVGAAMSYVVTANPAPTTYAAKSLPAGLKINAKTGVIFGKPTKAGEYTVTLQALRKGAATLSAVKTFRVLQAPTFKLPAKVNVTRNKAFRSAPKVSAYPTASFSVFSGALPEGITLNPITGQISGKTGTLKGNYPVTIRGSNEAGTTDKNTVLVVK